MKTVSIYQLKHPITLEIRYVGKTIESLNKRLEKHIYNRMNNSKVNKWCKKLKDLGLKPLIELIEVCSEENWQEREIYWIAFYKKEGNLLNIALGGESGNLGYKHTEEAKQKIALANSKPKSKEWIENAKQAMTQSVATPILQFSKQGIFLKRWESFCFAAKEINPDNYKAAIKNIHAVCNNKRKSAYNFIWTYENTELKDKELLG